MSQLRRERFEEQLRSLQNDISNLSQKLSIPASVNPVRSPSATTTTENRDFSSIQSLRRSFTDVDGSNGVTDTFRTDDDSINGGDKSQIIRLKRDLQNVSRERDDALFKLENANKEIEALRASARESNKLRVVYEHMKQDFESLQISFESSERIRRQQKELISMLQRTQGGGGAGDGFSSGVVLGGGLDSNLSVGSLLSTSSVLGRETMSSQTCSPSVVAENKSWLNAYTMGSTDEISELRIGSASHPVVYPPARNDVAINAGSDGGSSVHGSYGNIEQPGQAEAPRRHRRVKSKKGSASASAGPSRSRSSSAPRPSSSGAAQSGLNGASSGAGRRGNSVVEYPEHWSQGLSSNGGTGGSGAGGGGLVRGGGALSGPTSSAGSGSGHTRRVVSSSTGRSMTTAPRPQPTANRRHPHSHSQNQSMNSTISAVSSSGGMSTRGMSPARSATDFGSAVYGGTGSISSYVLSPARSVMSTGSGGVGTGSSLHSRVSVSSGINGSGRPPRHPQTVSRPRPASAPSGRR